MSDSIQHSLNSLRALSPELNQASNEAARQVAEIETILEKECEVGIPTEIMVGTDDRGQTLWLSYERIGGRYRFGVSQRMGRIDEERASIVDRQRLPEERTVPWSDIPRIDRLKTFKLLPALLEKLVEQVKSGLEEAKGAAEASVQLQKAIEERAGAPTVITSPWGGDGRQVVEREDSYIYQANLLKSKKR